MDQLTNHKHRIGHLISNNEPSSQPAAQAIKYKKKKCNDCNKIRKFLDESNQICHICYKTKSIFEQKSSGNKIIDDFIR